MDKDKFYDSRLQVAYTDLNKNVYYEFVNEGMMTYKRFMSAQVNERSIRLGLTPEFLNEAITKGLDIVYNGKHNERELREMFGAIFLAMKARAGFVCDEDQYLRLACVYYLIEGEPVDEVNEQFTLHKIKMLAENPDAKDFFLQGAISKTYVLTTVSLDVMKDCFAMATQRTEIAPTLPK